MWILMLVCFLFLKNWVQLLCNINNGQQMEMYVLWARSAPILRIIHQRIAVNGEVLPVQSSAIQWSYKNCNFQSDGASRYFRPVILKIGPLTDVVKVLVNTAANTIERRFIPRWYSFIPQTTITLLILHMYWLSTEYASNSADLYSKLVLLSL